MITSIEKLMIRFKMQNITKQKYRQILNATNTSKKGEFSNKRSDY